MTPKDLRTFRYWIETRDDETTAGSVLAWLREVDWTFRCRYRRDDEEIPPGYMRWGVDNFEIAKALARDCGGQLIVKEGDDKVV